MATHDFTWAGLPGARHIADEEARAVLDVLARRTLYRGGGPGEAGCASRAEDLLAQLSGRRYALLLNSGTSALLAALVAAGVRPNDEVIVPAYGWLGVLTCIAQLGAVPVIAPLTTGLRLDRAQLDRCIGPRTRALIPVHACGLACAIPRVPEHVAVIDDACQALGARHTDGRWVGGPGTQASFVSFQAYKIASAGEGGALLTDDASLYQAAVSFHDAGLDRLARTRAEHAPIMATGRGLNLRISELAAAIIGVQLERLDAVLDAQRSQQQRLCNALEPLLARGLARVLEPDPGAQDNATFVLLEAESADAAAAIHTQLRRRSIAIEIAGRRPYHALSGWLQVLEHNAIPHRVIDRAQSEAILQRTLLLEVNPQLPDDGLRALADAAAGVELDARGGRP